jgi:hypothetical protein
MLKALGIKRKHVPVPQHEDLGFHLKVMKKLYIDEELVEYIYNIIEGDDSFAQTKIIYHLHYNGKLQEFLEPIVKYIRHFPDDIASTLLKYSDNDVKVQKHIFHLCFKHYNTELAKCLTTGYSPTSSDLLEISHIIFLKNNKFLLEVLLSFYPKDLLYSIKDLLLRDANKYGATSCISIIESI